MGGKPLIAYTIEASLKSKIDRTIVSTDSEEIASIARKYGAEVPFMRPLELGADNVPAIAVIQHCLHWLSENENYFPDIVVYLQPTCPFRTNQHIDEGIQLLSKSPVDSLVGISEVTRHPYWMFTMDNNRLEEFIAIPNKPERRQELPKLYAINGALYMTQKKYFDQAGASSSCINLHSVIGLPMDKMSSLDIDEETDFVIAEALLRLRATRA